MSADRQRRYRLRKSAGLFPVLITINQDVVDALVEAGCLEEWDEADRAAISRAIERSLGMSASDDRDA